MTTATEFPEVWCRACPEPADGPDGWCSKHRPPAMLPGQEPYTADGLARLHGLVLDAAEGDPGEANEPPPMTDAERDELRAALELDLL